MSECTVGELRSQELGKRPESPALPQNSIPFFLAFKFLAEETASIVHLKDKRDNHTSLLFHLVERSIQMKAMLFNTAVIALVLATAGASEAQHGFGHGSIGHGIGHYGYAGYGHPGIGHHGYAGVGIGHGHYGLGNYYGGYGGYYHPGYSNYSYPSYGYGNLNSYYPAYNHSYNYPRYYYPNYSYLYYRGF